MLGRELRPAVRGAQRLDLRQRHRRHRAVPVGGAIHFAIVDTDEDAVRRQVQVGLDDVRAVGQRAAERGQRVLRAGRRVAAVRMTYGFGRPGMLSCRELIAPRSFRFSPWRSRHVLRQQCLSPLDDRPHRDGLARFRRNVSGPDRPAERNAGVTVAFFENMSCEPICRNSASLRRSQPSCFSRVRGLRMYCGATTLLTMLSTNRVSGTRRSTRARFSCCSTRRLLRLFN